MHQPSTPSKHDTAVVTPTDFAPTLTLVRDSAHGYCDEYNTLEEEAEKNHAPITLGIIAIVVGFLCLCASLIIALVGVDGDLQRLMTSSEVPFTGLDLGGVVLIVAGFAVTMIFGSRDSRIEKNLHAMKVEHEAKDFTLWFQATLAQRAEELVLDAITVEVRDRLYRLLDEGEDEAVTSAVRMLRERAEKQAQQEKDDAARARREALEGMAREALGGQAGWL